MEIYVNTVELIKEFEGQLIADAIDLIVTINLGCKTATVKLHDNEKTAHKSHDVCGPIRSQHT